MRQVYGEKYIINFSYHRRGICKIIYINWLIKSMHERAVNTLPVLEGESIKVLVQPEMTYKSHN